MCYGFYGDFHGWKIFLNIWRVNVRLCRVQSGGLTARKSGGVLQGKRDYSRKGAKGAKKKQTI